MATVTMKLEGVLGIKIDGSIVNDIKLNDANIIIEMECESFHQHIEDIEKMTGKKLSEEVFDEGKYVDTLLEVAQEYETFISESIDYSNYDNDIDEEEIRTRAFDYLENYDGLKEDFTKISLEEFKSNCLEILKDIEIVRAAEVTITKTQTKTFHYLLLNNEDAYDYVYDEDVDYTWDDDTNYDEREVEIPL